MSEAYNRPPPLAVLEMCLSTVFDSQEELSMPTEVHTRLYHLVLEACSELPLTGANRLYKLFKERAQQTVNAERLRIAEAAARGVDDENEETERKHREAYKLRRKNALIVFQSLADYTTRYMLPMIEDIYSSLDGQEVSSVVQGRAISLTSTDLGEDAAAGDDLGQNAFTPLQGFRGEFIAQVSGLLDKDIVHGENFLIDEQYEQSKWSRKKLDRSEVIPFQWALAKIPVIEGPFSIREYMIDGQETYQPADTSSEETLNEVKRAVFRDLVDLAPEGYHSLPADIWIGVCPEDSLQELWDMKYMFGLANIASLYKTDKVNYALSMKSALIHYSMGNNGGYHRDGPSLVVYIAWRFTNRDGGARVSLSPSSFAQRTLLPRRARLIATQQERNETPYHYELARCISLVFDPTEAERSMTEDTRMNLYELVYKVCNTQERNNAAEYLYSLLRETVQRTVGAEMSRRRTTPRSVRGGCNETEKSLREVYKRRRHNALVIFKPLYHYACRMQLPYIESMYYDFDD